MGEEDKSTEKKFSEENNKEPEDNPTKKKEESNSDTKQSNTDLENIDIESSEKDPHTNDDSKENIEEIKRDNKSAESKEEEEGDIEENNADEPEKEIEDNEINETKEEFKEEKIEIEKEPEIEKKQLSQTIRELNNKVKEFYFKKPKKLLIFPAVLLIIAIIVIGIHIAVTGDFVKKDVSLKGGITITIQKDIGQDINEIENYLNNNFPNSDLSVRSLKQLGSLVGIIIDGTEDLDGNKVIEVLSSKIGKIGQEEYSVAVMGSSLGAAFFKEILKAIFISFLFMGIVVFWYFGEDLKTKVLATFLTIISGFLMFSGNSSIIKDIFAYLIGISLIVIYIKKSIPSFIVILNVFSDVVVTLAIVNLLGMKLSTAGIAAFLMIIGYSVDTNILLSTKILKRKEGTLDERLSDSLKTGLLMTLTTSAAIIIALIFTQSDVIKQIMTILLIGLIVDMIYTWLQNAVILRLYVERKK